MKNLIFVAIYYTSGMSRIPKTILFLNMFTFFSCFFKALFWGPTPGESVFFGLQVGVFWMLLGSVFEVLLVKASGSRFSPFWDGSGLYFGVVFVTFWTQQASLHKIMKNLIFEAIYYTSGMSRIPKTMLFLNMFTCFWLLFFKALFWGQHFSDFCDLGCF